VTTTPRTYYTTARLHADELCPADVAMIGDTWSWVGGTWDSTHLADAAREFGEDSDEYRKIERIVNQVSADGEGVYVAVRYLHATVHHAVGEHRYNPATPSFKIAAYSQYELIEIQIRDNT
jgi:hypothetical protein